MQAVAAHENMRRETGPRTCTETSVYPKAAALPMTFAVLCIPAEGSHAANIAVLIVKTAALNPFAS